MLELIDAENKCYRENKNAVIDGAGESKWTSENLDNNGTEKTETTMSKVRVLVGTKKGAFILTSDGKREQWDVSGPHFAGWEMYHLKGSPAHPDRLYASHYAPPAIAVWNTISTVSAPRAADVTLTAVCGAGTSAELRYVAVIDNVLVVVHNELVNGGLSQLEKVCLFKDAAAMTATRPPDSVASDASLHPTGSNSDKALLTRDAHLLVMDRDGVAIFKNALDVPEFVTKLTIANPEDMLVLE